MRSERTVSLPLLLVTEESASLFNLFFKHPHRRSWLMWLNEVRQRRRWQGWSIEGTVCSKIRKGFNMHAFTSKIDDHMTLRSAVITSTTDRKAETRLSWNHDSGLHSEYKLQTIKITERERETGFTSIMCERAGVKITPKTFLCLRVSHLSLHRESPVFSSIKSRRCAARESARSLCYPVTDLLRRRSPSIWPGNPPSTALIYYCRGPRRVFPSAIVCV